MLLEVLESGTILYVMLAAAAAGVLGRLLVNGRYGRLLRQSADMGNAKDKRLRQWKVKFENTYRSGNGVQNVPVYIERNLSQYRLLGFRLSGWERFPRLLARFLSLGGLAAAFFVYWYEDSARLALLYGACGLLLGGALLFWDELLDTPGKAARLRLSLRDYFENTLAGRLESGRSAAFSTEGAGVTEASGVPAAEPVSDAARNAVLEAAAADAQAGSEPDFDSQREREEAAGREPDADFLRSRLERIAAGRHEGVKRKLSAQEERLIEDIIREYLYE